MPDLPVSGEHITPAQIISALGSSNPVMIGLNRTAMPQDPPGRFCIRSVVASLTYGLEVSPDGRAWMPIDDCFERMQKRFQALRDKLASDGSGLSRTSRRRAWADVQRSGRPACPPRPHNESHGCCAIVTGVPFRHAQ